MSSEVVRKIRDDIANDFLERIRKMMENFGKNVTGAAIDAWEHKPGSDTIGNTDQAMWNIEFGREPGSHVPLEPLAEWAMLKFGMSEKEAYAAAVSIENHIYEEGIPPTRVIKMVLADMAT